MKKLLLLTTFLLSIPPLANACRWDYETLASEKATWPGIDDLIAGKFPQHSQAYYKWIVADRQDQLKKDQENLQAMDDLAVALDALGKPKQAVDLMEKKHALKPGLYETEANWGTFLIHAGKLEQGLEHLRRAVEINPDAHFGREIYQIKLVEYVLKIRDEKDQFRKAQPTEDIPDLPLKAVSNYYRRNFKSFLFDDMHPKEEELEKAIKGVSGMVRFGQSDHPILMEALGDLLHEKEYLAARAYLRAAESAPEKAKAGYRSMAERALAGKSKRRMLFGSKRVSLEEVEKDFKKEREKAKIYLQELWTMERKWIRQGKRPDDEYLKWLKKQ